MTSDLPVPHNDTYAELDRLMFDRRRAAEQARDCAKGWDRRDAANYAEGWRDAEDAIRDWIKDHA